MSNFFHLTSLSDIPKIINITHSAKKSFILCVLEKAMHRIHLQVSKYILYRHVDRLCKTKCKCMKNTHVHSTFMNKGHKLNKHDQQYLNLFEQKFVQRFMKMIRKINTHTYICNQKTHHRKHLYIKFPMR